MNNDIVFDFEALYNDLKEMIVIVNEDASILAVNNTTLDILSYTKDEILNKSVSEICCDKTLENVVKCNIDSFSVNLCSKYKQLVAINGKLNFVNINNIKVAILKLFKTDEVIFSSVFSANKERTECSNFIKDLNGRYIFVNDVFEKHFNLDKSEVIGKFDHELWDEGLSYKLRREDLYVISTKKTYVTYNTQIIGDEIFYYETSKSPVFGENNKVVAVLGNTKDITESVKLRNELVIQNEQLSIIYKILNNSSSKINIMSLFNSLYKDFKALLNIDNMSVFLHNSDIDKLEYCTSYGITKDFMDMYDNNDKFRDFIYEVFSSRKSVPMSNVLEFEEIKAKNTGFGETCYCACYPLVYNGESFGVIYFGCNSEQYSYSWDNKFMEAVCKNISILLQNAILYTKLEENLTFEKEANEQINLYFDTTIDFFCIVDKHCCMKKVGKQMLETLGYTEQEITHLPVIDIVHGDEKNVFSDMKDNFNKEGSAEFIIRMLCKNGEYRIVDWNVKHLKDREIYICSGRDLSYKKDLEQKEKIVEESFQLEKLKSEFLANISHELRTPIAIIYGSILNMETSLRDHKTVLPKKTYEYVKSVKKNTFRLLRLFNNILEITNVSAGFSDLNLKTYNIVRVVEDISLSLSELLKDQDVSLIFDTDIEERYLNIDSGKMERVILNLISNSVKYSKQGVKTEILIRVYEDHEKVYISIKDNGIGIDSTHLSKIFDKFTQINGCMTRNAEGSGIGLYLVKIMLQMQGANIKVNSTIGEGSEFIIEFPIFNDLEYNAYQEDFDDDFSVKIENFDMEFSDIAY